MCAEHLSVTYVHSNRLTNLLRFYDRLSCFAELAFIFVLEARRIANLPLTQILPHKEAVLIEAAPQFPPNLSNVG